MRESRGYTYTCSLLSYHFIILFTTMTLALLTLSCLVLSALCPTHVNFSLATHAILHVPAEYAAAIKAKERDFNFFFSVPLFPIQVCLFQLSSPIGIESSPEPQKCSTSSMPFILSHPIHQLLTKIVSFLYYYYQNHSQDFQYKQMPIDSL